MEIEFEQFETQFAWSHYILQKTTLKPVIKEIQLKGSQETYKNMPWKKNNIGHDKNTIYDVLIRKSKTDKTYWNANVIIYLTSTRRIQMSSFTLSYVFSERAVKICTSEDWSSTSSKTKEKQMWQVTGFSKAADR